MMRKDRITGKTKLLIVVLAEAAMLLALVLYLLFRQEIQIELPQDQFSIVRYGVFGEQGAYLDESFGEAEIASAPFALDVGRYQVTVQYQTDTSLNDCQVKSQQSGYYNIASDKCLLDNAVSTMTYTISVYVPTKDARIYFDLAQEGSLTVTGVQVQTAAGSATSILLQFLLCLVAVNLFLILSRFFRKSSSDNRQLILAISCITIFASYPLFTDFLTKGHDLQFQLLRIEGIAQGLLSGQFPVRIQPNWLHGNGYAVSVFYGDILLYIPALLRLCGVSVQGAYKIFVVAINLFTALTSYWCFYRITKQRKQAVIACMLYTLSAYRIIDLYIRGAVGEYSAMAFLPLILLGLYQIYESQDNNKKCVWLPAAVGFAGVLQTHLLTAEMAGLFTIIVCIILWRKTVQKDIFVTLCKTVFAAIVFSLWFLVPFLSYMQEEFVVNDPFRLAGRIQNLGVFPTQIFMLHGAENAFSMTADRGISGEMPLQLGIAFAVILMLFIYMSAVDKNSIGRKSKICFWLGLFALLLSTTMFPYDNLCAVGEKITYLIMNIQFPWRFLSIASLVITALYCFLVNDNKDKPELKQLGTVTMLILMLCTLGQGIFLMGEYLLNNEAWRVYEGSQLNDSEIVGQEYLPRETDISALYKEPVPSEGVVIQTYMKKYNTITLEVKAEREGVIELPLIYYPGYQVTDQSSDSNVSIGKSENGTVTVSVAEDYSGTCQISFKEPWYWRVAEILSLLFTVVVILGVTNKKWLTKRSLPAK